MDQISNFRAGLQRLTWLPIITGLISIGLGIWCLCCPTTSLEVFAYVFAGCLCASGFLNLLLAFTNTRIGWNWGWALAIGIIELGCGIWMFTFPIQVITSIFMFVIAVWIIVAAINALCESFMMASNSPGWTIFSIILLVLTLIFAFIFLSNPITGGIVVWLWIGLSLIFFGFYRLMFAMTIRRINRM